MLSESVKFASRLRYGSVYFFFSSRRRHTRYWRDWSSDVCSYDVVKIQYPGAATALMADLNQLARLARLFAALFPGLDVKPLISELKARVVEELDYGLEADAQRTFAAAYADDPEIVVPRVVASAPKVIVSEWLEGTPLSRIIATGTREQRDRAGHLLAVLNFSRPAAPRLLDGDAQRTFAAAYADDPEIVVPRVVASAPKVIVSDWLEGTPLSRIIATGTREQRDRAGHLMAVLNFSGPQRARLLHADPHPGNFRLLEDGRLGVIDFGATARLPDGLPEPIGRLVRWALEGRAEDVLADLRTEGFVRPGVEVDAQGVLEYLLPLLEPIQSRYFRFTRAWMQEQATRIADPRTEANRLGRMLNLPPAYLLIHRVTIGSIGVLCQLDAGDDYRSVLEEWPPGLTG